MITGLLLTILLGFINFVFGLLSGAVLWLDVSQGVTDFFNYIYQFNSIFPVDTAFKVIQYTTAFWVLVFGFSFFKWLIHIIRGA